MSDLINRYTVYKTEKPDLNRAGIVVADMMRVLSVMTIYETKSSSFAFKL